MRAAQCVNCGLPMTRNTHPDAGKPEMLNVVGASYGCLPCAERRANGRRDSLNRMSLWLAQCSRDGVAVTADLVLQRLSELEDARRASYRSGRVFNRGPDDLGWLPTESELQDRSRFIPVNGVEMDTESGCVLQITYQCVRHEEECPVASLWVAEWLTKDVGLTRVLLGIYRARNCRVNT